MKHQYYGHDLLGREVWVKSGKTWYLVTNDTCEELRSQVTVGTWMDL